LPFATLLKAASACSKSFSLSFLPPDGVAAPDIAELSESDLFLGFMTRGNG
jgi:hypothetical protein